jgi:6-phosphogluconate dehydrogenase
LFIDCGVSGGPEGSRYGASLMIGGKRKNFEAIEELFRDFAFPNGYEFFDGVGAGHFVKMVHNGIEYGMMQSIAEGFTILKKSKYKLDLSAVCDVYNHGSVIESRLIGWLKKAFELHGENLKSVSGVVEHSGEGKWTLETARELNIIAKVIHEALLFRLQSKKNPNYTGQILSALREQFGGHKQKNSHHLYRRRKYE